MELLREAVDFVLHIDVHLGRIVSDYGVWTYLVLFVVVFCETGLVVTPFLPGDSLLFAAGAFAAKGSLDVALVFGVLAAAAILGDSANYALGHFLGPRALREHSRIFKREYLDKTQHYFERYGNKTIVIARFVPIVRTFAPFMAGVGAMRYGRFAAYNVGGGLLWVTLFVFGGYFFGNVPFVEENFSLVVIAIVLISVLPAVVEVVRHKLSVRAR
ncbi:MAG: DedA family protein [Coriobacteriia bacterium]